MSSLYYTLIIFLLIKILLIMNYALACPDYECINVLSISSVFEHLLLPKTRVFKESSASFSPKQVSKSMSKTNGSLSGMFSSASGRGQGNFRAADTKNIDKESKFIEEMYDKRDENIELRKGNAQKFVDSFYSVGMFRICKYEMTHKTNLQTIIC